MKHENKSGGHQGRFGDPEGHAEAGRKGGRAVVKKMGIEHMRAIGRLSGKNSTPEQLEDQRRKAGVARAEKGGMSELGKKGAAKRWKNREPKNTV